MKESNVKSKGKKALDIIVTTAGVLLLLITTIGVVTKLVSKDAMIFGVRSDIVLSESMASINDDVKEEYENLGWTNQLQVCDWIFTSKVSSEDELKVGDIVTYHNPIVGVTTHRIVGIKEYQGKTYFTIRADAVEARNVDGDFSFDTIIGKVTSNAGQFGHVIYFLQSIYGVIMMVGLAMICFVYSFLLDFQGFKKNKKDNNEKIN